MLRGSGTEPILRIYAEAKSDADARKFLNLGVTLDSPVLAIALSDLRPVIEEPQMGIIRLRGSH